VQTEAQITSAIQDLANDLPGFIAASLVDLDSGMTLGVYAKRTDFDLTSASAYNSELVKQKQKIMEALGLKMELEDITITLSDQIHMIQLTDSESSFIYLAVDRHGSNLALIRRAMKAYLPRFEQ
jgi:predicted regulator of Ras-like GTPase activity (Roadblock/LC7/MglB family)